MEIHYGFHVVIHAAFRAANNDEFKRKLLENSEKVKRVIKYVKKNSSFADEDRNMTASGRRDFAAREIHADMFPIRNGDGVCFDCIIEDPREILY